MPDNIDDLLPLHDEHESSGFDVVLRGYDRRQVEDYVERVDAALASADRLHGEDATRLAALETQVLSLQSAVAEAEQRAADRPGPASQLAGRLAEMLRLAEEEAEQIIERANEQASRTMSERTAELDSREVAIAAAAGEADQTRLDAQRDAEAVRVRAHQEAVATVAEARRQADEMADQVRQQCEAKRQQTEQDIVQLHEQARQHNAEAVAQGQREVEDLARQRDTIAAQLQAIRETLGAAAGPLAGPSATGL